MMQKTVRYHITESDDRPVVRTVSVATRQEPAIEQRPATSPVVENHDHTLDSKRSRLRARLKTVRHHGTNA
jgi:hypothetical protein